MRDLPQPIPFTLEDLHKIERRYRTNPGAGRIALWALVARGWDPNQLLDGQLPLYQALLHQRNEWAQSLLSVGANPMLPSEGPSSPSLLQKAVAWNELGVVKAMLGSAQANVLETDLEGKTLLHLAANHGSIAMMEALVEAGSDPWTPDSEGTTAYDTLLATWGQHAIEKHAFSYQDLAKRLKEMRAPALAQRLEQAWAPARTVPKVRM